MHRDEQLKIYDEVDSAIKQLAASKGADYANVDVLSNFKNIAIAVKALDIDVSTPAGNALFMVLLKINRIANLARKGTKPNNESVKDSYIDGIHYFKLALLCALDQLNELE